MSPELGLGFVLLGPCLIALTLLVVSGLEPTTKTPFGLVRVAVAWLAIGAGLVLTLVSIAIYLPAY